MNQRILSVDIFRGATIAAMILVNNPGTWGAVYAPFLHAEWHGLTPTDLIFPFFLFIVGISIVLAYSKKKETIVASTYKKIISRSLKLIFLGLFLSGFILQFPFIKDIGGIRLPGVLQRIGIVFFIASLLFLKMNWKVLLGVFGVILVGYWVAMTQIPINGKILLLTKESNLASMVDLTVLTRAHMWKEHYDPEGLLSTLPAIATTIFGVFIGWILIHKRLEKQKKLLYFFMLGVISLLFGYLWNIYFPLNKALWTSSFVLVTGGWACVIFGAIYYISDILHYNNWGKPFIIFGSNAISVFFLSGFIAKCFYLIHLPNGKTPHEFLYSSLTHFISIPKVSSLLYAITVVLFYYVVALFLFKKKIFIKV